jgi:hypothetical protein
MRRQPSPMHVLHLVRLLRVAATGDMRANDTMVRDDFDCLTRCLDAALANDAADALEALLRGTVANDHRARGKYVSPTTRDRAMSEP